jgi:hypothetical protein
VKSELKDVAAPKMWWDSCQGFVLTTAPPSYYIGTQNEITRVRKHAKHILNAINLGSEVHSKNVDSPLSSIRILGD